MFLIHHNLRHLRAFLIASRLASINAGAEAANMSQPAVTQAIGKLESLFGAPLLVRRATGSYPTEAGEILSLRLARFFSQMRSALVAAAGPPVRHDEAELLALEQRVTAVQIRALVAVVDGGSFSEGARLGGMGESSLNRAARDCERSIGRPLFIRSAGGVGPNKVASELARRLKVAAREIEQAAEEISALRGVVAGRISIACLPLARTLILPRTVNALLSVYPQSKVEISDGAYEKLLTDLRSGVVDFLIGALRNPPPVQDVVELALLDDPFAVVARTGHPLLSQPHITRDMLAACDWVIPRQGTPIRRAFEHLFNGLSGRPRIQVETSSLVVTRAILIESDRLTLLSRRQIAIEEQARILEAVPFPLSETSRPIGVSTRANWLPSPLHRSFLEFLKIHTSSPFEGQR